MKFLIILLFPFAAVAQERNCQEYNLDVYKSTLTKSEQVCYASELTKVRKKYVLTISTNKYSNTFAVLRSFPISTEKYKGTLTFVVIIGEPDQLYVIREESNSLDYFFSVRPIQMSDRVPRRIKGRVLEVSNTKICNEEI